MARMSRTALVVLLAGAAFACAPVSAAPPTPEQMTEILEAWSKKKTELREAGKGSDYDAYKAAARETLETLPIEEMTVAQLSEVTQILNWGGPSDRVESRLDALAKDRGPDGAVAASLKLELAASAEKEQLIEAAREALAHPGMREALKEGRGANMFMQIGGMGERSPEALAECAPELETFLERTLSTDMPYAVAARMQYLYEGVMNLGPDHQRLIDDCRRMGLRMARGAMDTADEKQKERLESAAEFFDGAYAKGELINHRAPAITVEWSSDPKLASLADLKGEVVVLDFWATWCGPCIRAFPEMREVVERYEGYPVRLVGVTSIQGAHYGSEGKVDCEGDPERERSLMPSFMDEKDMTWTVVFAKENVFNPQYGVSGIPHMAILAPDGTVRFNTVRPGDMEGFTQKLDGLLKEFNLPAPSPYTKPEGEAAAH